MKIYSKPGGWQKTDEDVKGIRLSNVQKYKDDEEFEILTGTVVDNSVKLTYGDDVIHIGFPTITMFLKNSPYRSSGTIKVFYKDTVPRKE